MKRIYLKEAVTSRKLAASNELHQLFLIKGCLKTTLLFQLIPHGDSNTLSAGTRERSTLLLGLEDSSQKAVNKHRTLHSGVHRRWMVPALSNGGDVPHGVVCSSHWNNFPSSVRAPTQSELF